MIKKRRLFFDIETSPNIGMFWSAGWKLNVGTENIIKERAIICICYKWGGHKKVFSLTWDKNQCDKKMLKAFVEVAMQADELVGHNGDKYDLTWIRTRCLLHGIKFPPDVKTIDTLKFSRQKFRFNSNRLDYIGKFLGFGGKIKTSFSLWRDILLFKDKRAMLKMVHYCKGDVWLLEKIFNRLCSYLPAKVHYGALNGHGKRSCPECGSLRNHTHQTRTTAAGTTRLLKQCNDCHKYFTVSPLNK